MCGIIVSTSSTPLTKTDLLPLSKRGPDYSTLLIQDGISFGFTRLAIMGLSSAGNQPFKYQGNIVVANAEIYNHKSLKQPFKEVSFQSESDCEVLLPLYQTLGVNMFSILDAEFAIVLYDQTTKHVIAARDPIGIRPLFYGYHKDDEKIVFASEVKALIHHVNTVYPFPIGHYYIDGSFIQYSSLTTKKPYHKHLFYEITEHIHDTLKDAVLKRLDADAPLGFLLSGGLDSSLVCAIAKQASDHPLRTFSIGMDTDPIDLKYAKKVADYLECNHTEVTITKRDVLDALEPVIIALESYDITTIRASIGMYLIAQYIHEKTNIKTLMTGEVSDELFGYKYTDFAPNKEAFQQESIKRINELYAYDVLRADRCLAANSLEARVPFSDTTFAQYVINIDPIFKMNKYKVGKFLLRKAFEEGDYLPRDILYREKAAFSDAVGHSLVDTLKAFAETQYTNEQFESLKHQYQPMPFTKEALLYRELFDKHYPNHAHLIPDYWMPNKAWNGCQVDDPSARVLSNYGKSGD